MKEQNNDTMYDNGSSGINRIEREVRDDVTDEDGKDATED